MNNNPSVPIKYFIFMPCDGHQNFLLRIFLRVSDAGNRIRLQFIFLFTYLEHSIYHLVHFINGAHSAIPQPNRCLLVFFTPNLSHVVVCPLSCLFCYRIPLTWYLSQPTPFRLVFSRISLLLGNFNID